jgi:exosome complex RNA-binding protein Rrp42 (RNase PH superfamily)
LADPTQDEVQIAQTEFITLMDQDGILCGQFKAGGEAIDLSVIREANRLALLHTKELVSLINK